MPKYPKNHKDVEYYVKGRKKRITGTTKATSDFLAIVHETHPDLTISELLDLISNKNQYILNPEAVEILQEHVKLGFGGEIPAWK